MWRYCVCCGEEFWSQSGETECDECLAMLDDSEWQDRFIENDYWEEP